jgi:hypothetical protein
MIMPTNEEVDRDVTSYYYAYGLQAFCDATCHFVMISSKLCSSTNDNTAYIVTQLSKDVKAGLLPSKYHVVLGDIYIAFDLLNLNILLLELMNQIAADEV